MSIIKLTTLLSICWLSCTGIYKKCSVQLSSVHFVGCSYIRVTADKEIWSWVRKNSGHRDLSTSKFSRYVLARLCGIPTLSTDVVYNQQSCNQLLEQTGCEGRGMRSSGSGWAAQTATWCIPENVIDDNLPAEPAYALHEHCINWWFHEICVAHVLLLEEPTGKNCIHCSVSYPFVSGKLG
jgi:hypothetical protein